MKLFEPLSLGTNLFKGYTLEEALDLTKESGFAEVELSSIILVIAEKPSVAQSIAKVLGATSRKDGYMEGSNYIVSWCFGHLVELADASSYDERYAKWRYDDLPIVPKNWMFEVTKDKAQQFKVLSSLCLLYTSRCV